MKTKKKALFLGVVASLFATAALDASTYYIGSTLGAVNAFGGGSPLGGSITAVDAGPVAPTSVWDLSSAPIDPITGEHTVTLANTNTYILENGVFVRGGTLKINDGTIIRGQPASTATNFDVGVLVIARGAKIVASGLPASPIIFTTASTTGTKSGGRAAGASPAFWDSAPATSPRPLVVAGVSSTGFWGGLAILGNSISNVDRNLRGVDNGGAAGGAYDDAVQVTFADIHGGSASADDRQQLEGIAVGATAHTQGLDRFGGNVTNDNSGVLRYVSLRYCGSNFSLNSEINGLTLGAVGAGTTIDNVEVFGCTDDGVEVFGGNVNLKHLCVMGVEDDMFDFDAGYCGTAQFLFGVGWGLTGSGSASADYTDRAFEWDGSYRLERPEGYRASPEASQAINAGGLGAVTSNQSQAASVSVFNATTIGNVYTGPAVPLSNAGIAANNDRSRGAMFRDQAAPFLVNSIILPTSYGYRVATMGTEDYTATIKRLENSQAAIKSDTFYKAGFSTATDFIGAGAADTAAGANNALRSDTTPARIVAVLTAAGANNRFTTIAGGPLSSITVNESLTTGSIDPRPIDAYNAGTGAPTAVVPVGAGLEAVSYRGAFSDDPFSDIWTTGWTAANKLGIIVN